MIHDDELLTLMMDARVRELLDEHGCDVQIVVRPRTEAPPAGSVGGSAESAGAAAVAGGAAADGAEPRLAAFRDALRREAVQRRVCEHDAQKLMALGELVAGVVHEVRNIVTAIRGFAQVASRRQDAAQVGKLLATIERESSRCAEVTASFLRFARRDEPSRERINVGEVVAQVATLVRHQLRIHDIELALDLADDLPDIRADRNEIIQSLVNLVLNAQQAIDGAGAITLRTTRAGANVEIDIIDTGPGVPAELRERIFEPFFTTKPAGTGTGLGLAVSARMIAANDGVLSLAGADGSGARFVIRLPGLEG